MCGWSHSFQARMYCSQGYRSWSYFRRSWYSLHNQRLISRLWHRIGSCLCLSVCNIRRCRWVVYEFIQIIFCQTRWIGISCGPMGWYPLSWRIELPQLTNHLEKSFEFPNLLYWLWRYLSAYFLGVWHSWTRKYYIWHGLWEYRSIIWELCFQRDRSLLWFLRHIQWVKHSDIRRLSPWPSLLRRPRWSRSPRWSRRPCWSSRSRQPN